MERVPALLWCNEVLPYITITCFVSLRRVNKAWNQGCLSILQIHLNRLRVSKKALLQTTTPLITTIQHLRKSAKTSLERITDSGITEILHEFSPFTIENNAISIVLSYISHTSFNSYEELREMTAQRLKVILKNQISAVYSTGEEYRSVRCEIRHYLSHAREERKGNSGVIDAIGEYWELMLRAEDIERKELSEVEEQVIRLEREETAFARLWKDRVEE